MQLSHCNKAADLRGQNEWAHEARSVAPEENTRAHTLPTYIRVRGGRGGERGLGIEGIITSQRGGRVLSDIKFTIVLVGVLVAQ